MAISLNDVQRGYDRWAAKPHNAKWVRKIDGTPIANDIVVNIFDELRDSATTEPSKPVAEAVKVKPWRVFEDISHDYWGIEEDNADGEMIFPPKRIDRSYLDNIVNAYNSALSTTPQPEAQGDKKVEATDAADAYVAEKGFEHSGGIIERAFEAGARWATLRSLPEGFRRQEIEDMLSIVQDEPQTVDGGGEYGPQESTDGWYTRLLRAILKKSEGA